jgi:hypothetical protein
MSIKLMPLIKRQTLHEPNQNSTICVFLQQLVQATADLKLTADKYKSTDLKS